MVVFTPKVVPPLGFFNQTVINNKKMDFYQIRLGMRELYVDLSCLLGHSLKQVFLGGFLLSCS